MDRFKHVLPELYISVVSTGIVDCVDERVAYSIKLANEIAGVVITEFCVWERVSEVCVSDGVSNGFVACFFHLLVVGLLEVAFRVDSFVC